MRTSVILMLLMTCYLNSAKYTTTMQIIERIRMLKDHIRHSLRNPSQSDPEPIPAYYESDENSPIPPISESDELKKDDKFKLKQTRTPPTTSKVLLRTETRTTPAPRVQLNERVTAISKLLAPPTVSTTRSGVEIFYRKSFDSSLLNTPVEWLHCSEHITPYLKGAKKELTRPVKVQENDYIVHRFINLLKTNITKMSRAEKSSIMYQMSKLKIRLYSWDSSAMRLLLNEIGIKYGQGQKVDFMAVKRGLMRLIGTLNVDLSNRTKLLVQARIFRPPCIPNNEHGSSRFVPGSTIPVPSLRMPDSVECVRRDQNNNCI